MKRAAVIISSIGLLILSPFVIATPLFATTGIGGRPANPDVNNPRTQSIFIHQLSGGQSTRDQLQVTNGTDEAADIEVYAVDGTATATGDMTCEQQSEQRDGAGGWLSLDKGVLHLAAKQSAPVDFTITVPKDADVGEHAACLVVQRKVAAQQTQGGIQLQTRQAVRVAIIVPGNIHREISIKQFTAEHVANKQQYNIVLANAGNVSADVQVELRVKDGSGAVVYKNGGQYPMIANKEKVLRFDSQLAPFWGGQYTAELTISYDKRAGKFGVSEDRSELVIKHADSVRLSFGPTIGAWAIIGGGAAVVVGAIVWAILRRRKKLGRSGLSVR